MWPNLYGLKPWSHQPFCYVCTYFECFDYQVTSLHFVCQPHQWAITGSYIKWRTIQQNFNTILIYINDISLIEKSCNCVHMCLLSDQFQFCGIFSASRITSIICWFYSIPGPKLNEEGFHNILMNSNTKV